MSLASTQFQSDTDSFFTTDDQVNDSHLHNINHNKTHSITAATATTDDSHYNNDNNDDSDYFIPSMEEFCMHSTSIYTPTNSPWYHPNQNGGDKDNGIVGDVHNHQLSNLFCTPRSIVTIQSIESAIDNIPIALKPNIWADGLTPVASQSQRDSKEQELRFHLEQHRKFQRHLQMQQEQYQQDQLLQKQLQLDLFTQKYYSYASMNKSEAVCQSISDAKADTSSSLHQLESPLLGQCSTFIPHRYTQQQCLTFRTYSGSIFTVPSKSRFFVIKSYNILDVNASFEHKIWTSTELGNKRLDKAFHELHITSDSDLDGKIFLFFLVNSLGKFCGVSQMRDCIDYNKTSDVWCEQTRWKGIFPVEWLLIKDVPNKFFQHLKVPANEFKPVTNSRDTQEIPYDIGISMLKIISSFRSNE